MRSIPVRRCIHVQSGSTGLVTTTSVPGQPPGPGKDGHELLHDHRVREQVVETRDVDGQRRRGRDDNDVRVEDVGLVASADRPGAALLEHLLEVHDVRRDHLGAAVDEDDLVLVRPRRRLNAAEEPTPPPPPKIATFTRRCGRRRTRPAPRRRASARARTRDGGASLAARPRAAAGGSLAGSPDAGG